MKATFISVIMVSFFSNSALIARSVLQRLKGCDNGTEAGGEVIVELKSQL